MTEQKPSVGRVVHYRSRGSQDYVFDPQCCAAIVTEVNEDTCGLAVLNPDGVLFARSIPYSNAKATDEDGTPARGGTWHWPERV